MTQAFPWPIQNVAEWLPWWQGAGFLLATFVLEDAATVGAGLLLAAGQVSWPVAFVSCFLGVWLGDAGLYTLARFGGRPWFERSSFKRYAARVARSEAWFADRGALVLIFSRCLPGARLPTYLAAGFLRWSAPRFLAVTGAAAFLWTLLVLRLVQTLGDRVQHGLAVWRHGGWVLLGALALLVVGWRWARRRPADFDWRRMVAGLERWRHWEFWPGWLFYPPVVVNYLRLAVKYRGLGLPVAANPGIFSGGLVGESKYAMLAQLARTSPEFTAAAAFIADESLSRRIDSLAAHRRRLGLQYPVVLKPDMGQRGAGVKLIRHPAEAEHYLRAVTAPVVLQAYAPGPGEAGIFYYRFPGESRGKIFGIVEKIFPTVTGDGRLSIAELVHRDPRARLIAGIYERRLGARWREVLPAGETLKLVEAGNHAQGCIFREGSHLFSPELEARIDGISRRLEGFFIGRYDIRFGAAADLRAGRNFQIVELNGAASESGNLYDARNSLWTAYGVLFRQWELVFQIGAANRRRGVACASPMEVWRKWREYAKISQTYPAAD